MHIAYVSLERQLIVDGGLETQTYAGVWRTLRAFTEGEAGVLVALHAGTHQQEGTEGFAREHVQTVYAQRILLIALLAIFGAGIRGAQLDIPVLGNRFTETQACAIAGLIRGKVGIWLECVEAGLNVPGGIDFLGLCAEGGAQYCGGNGDFF